MLILAIDACVLIGLLKVVSDDDIGFGMACLVSLVASIGTFALALALAYAIGIAGIFIGALIAAAALGAALSWLVGAEIKRAFLIAGIFMIVHVGISFAFAQAQ